MTMKIEQNKRRVGFPVQKNLDDFDDDFQTTISKRLTRVGFFTHRFPPRKQPRVSRSYRAA